MLYISCVVILVIHSTEVISSGIFSIFDASGCVYIEKAIIIAKSSRKIEVPFADLC